MHALQGKPRVAAVAIIAAGVLLLAINHNTIVREHSFYPAAILFGPVCLLFGALGLIDPRLLNRDGIQTGHQSAIRQAISVVVVLFGMAAGWALAHFFYGVW